MGSKAIKFRNKNNDYIYPCPYMPIGSIYISVNSTNPSTYFGGTWQQIKDRFLLACGSTYSNGATGGEATHKLTINEMPSHNHPVHLSGTAYSNITSNVDWLYESSYRIYGGEDVAGSNVGGNQAHNNMPPYLAVYVWKRVS